MQVKEDIKPGNTEYNLLESSKNLSIAIVGK